MSWAQDMLREARRDVRAWPGGQSVRAGDNNDDTFWPSTIGHLADDVLAGVPRAQELAALAETAAWDRGAADELLDLLAEHLAAAADAGTDSAMRDPLERFRQTGREGARKRDEGRGLSPLQRASLRAEEELGREATSSAIAQHLNFKGLEHAPTNVAKARRVLRKMGL